MDNEKKDNKLKENNNLNNFDEKNVNLIIANQKRQKLIQHLMKKYNLTENQTEHFLKKLETKNITKNVSPKPKENKYIEYQKPDVDELIGELIPSYHKNISIEVADVSLTFEMDSEKIDTIKEKVIKTLKRTKNAKIKFKALKDISFKIYQGEKIGIIGYNGAGKSTLLKTITGIYPPDKGFIKTNGKISPLLSLGAGFDFNYSGRKNIYLNGAVLGYDKKFLEKKEKEIIEFSELEEFIDLPIKNYSSGMLARLGFSIGNGVNPDILIIDEILGVGDASFRKKSTDKIISLMEDGTTVLLVSHSIGQIRKICDKAIWIDNGRVREIGEVNIVCDNYIKDSEKASAKQLKNLQLH